MGSRAPASTAPLPMGHVSEDLRREFVRRVVDKVAAGTWGHGPAALALQIVGLAGDPVRVNTAATLARTGARAVPTFARLVAELARPARPLTVAAGAMPVEDWQCEHGGTEMLCGDCGHCHDCWGLCGEALRDLEAERQFETYRDAGSAALAVLYVPFALVLLGVVFTVAPGTFPLALLFAGAVAVARSIDGTMAAAAVADTEVPR